MTGQLSNQQLRSRLERLREEVYALDQHKRGSNVPRSAPTTVRKTSRRTLRRLDRTQVTEVAQGYLDGLAVKDLAVRSGVNPSTVQKHVRRQRLPRRSPRLGPTHVQEAAELYANGEPLVKLGKRYGIGKDAVARALRKAGTEVRLRNGFSHPS